jgi:dihydrodipicolinate synthase/N-acetylneuraminate lyase
MGITDDRGVIAAALTPRGKHGDVDFGAAFELLDYLCAAGVSGIAMFAAAGEYPAFSTDERTRLLYLAVKRSRIPLLAGVGSTGLDASLVLAREARDAGAAGLLLPPAHFFPYPQPEIREFYLQFAAQVGKGAITYLSNTPSVTSEIALDTALELLATGRFAGIEEAGGNAESMARLQIASREGSFSVLTGDDASFACARANGAHGAVSASACAVPELMVALEGALLAGNAVQAARLDRMLQEFLAWVNRFPQPVVLKVATGLRGIKLGPLAVPVAPERQRKLDEFREWFTGWLPAVKKLATMNENG